MRCVLGLSLAGSSAVWVLVDTVGGEILAEEVVAVDSQHELATAAARSVRAFDLQTKRDIESIRLTWSDDVGMQGIRLRTKLRLYGFETVETVTQDAAREGRNKTARHLAPHLVMAYGAVRSGVDHTDENESLLQRLTAKIPTRLAEQAPMRLAEQAPMRLVAAGAAVIVVSAIGLYAFVRSSQSDVPEYTAAVGTPSQSAPDVGPASAAAPSGVPIPWAGAGPVPVPAVAPAPGRTPDSVAALPSLPTAVQPEAVTAPDAITDVELDYVELDYSAPEAVTATTMTPHLPVAHLPAVPAEPVAHLPVAHLPGPRAQAAAHLPGVPAPAAAPLPGAPAQTGVAPVQMPAVATPQGAPPPPLPPVLSTIFGALP